MSTPDSQPLLPARMLNEFVYCPRLFYIEWVEGRWADNADTAQGRWVHRSVDSGSGPMPTPGSAEAPLTTKSVQLSSPSLGLTATIDRVDHRDGTSSPVDYKKGRPDPEGNPWPADRAQALAQAALLHRAGYQVREAIISYAQIHRRVSVPWDRDAEQELIALIEQARLQAAALDPPPPLIDSPKCPRCSLVGLCLPDEIHSLNGRIPRPRRILPRDPDTRPLYVTEPGGYVTSRGGQIVVTKNKQVLADVRLIDISQVCVFGNVQVTTQALRKLWEAGAPVLWLSSGGWLNGWSQGELNNHVHLRLQQLRAHIAGAGIARQVVAGKIRNQRTLLRRNTRHALPAGLLDSLKDLATSAERAETTAELLGIEGAAARLYFANFTRMLNESGELGASFDQNGRSRRPPPDPLNALLSFSYSMLTKELVVTCLGVGLDPHVGVYHQPRFSRPSLALDLAEEFRALIADSVVLQVLNNGEIGPEHFVRRSVGTQLTPTGRRKVLHAFDRRLSTEVTHPIFGYRISYRRVLDVQARLLAAVMIGEVDRYAPMVTR